MSKKQEEVRTEAELFDTRELTGKLVHRMVEEFKAMPDVWQKLSEPKQEEVLGRCRRFAEEFVLHAIDVVAADERPHLQAVLDQVTVKDGLKAVLTMPKNSEDRHELIDAQGKDVLLVVVDVAAYNRGGEKVKAEKDQKELDISEAAK